MALDHAGIGNWSALWVAASVGVQVFQYLQRDVRFPGCGDHSAAVVLHHGAGVVVGAEINAEIEHAAAEHGRADAKLKGEKEAPAA